MLFRSNRSPTRAITGKTPFEAWIGRRPNLSHLRRFGCNAYLHVPNAQRTKLKPKARLCMFLGYVPNTTEQWRLWDGRHQRILSGSNVKFDESGFGNRGYEDPKMLEEISEDQIDQLSPPAPLRNRTAVDHPRGTSVRTGARGALRKIPASPRTTRRGGAP